jgi:hypothetical protein
MNIECVMEVWVGSDGDRSRRAEGRINTNDQAGLDLMAQEMADRFRGQEILIIHREVDPQPEFW